MLLAHPLHALAADGQDNQAITYSPAVRFLDVDPGARVTTTILIQNQTLVPVQFDVQVTDLEAGVRGASGGTPYEYVEAGTARRGAGAWLTPELDSFRLGPATQREVPVFIDVPADAGAGGHYGAVTFVASSTRDTGLLDADAFTPIPVLLTVSGDYQRDLGVTITPDDRLRWQGGTAGWTVELYNAGDLHENVSGRIRVDSILSGAASVPLQPGILLPGERRTQRVRFELRSAPDLWTADVDVRRDDAEPAGATAKSVLVLPIWLLFVVAGAVLVVWWRVRVRRARAHLDDEFDDDDDAFADAG